jgi:hypothetical protein
MNSWHLLSEIYGSNHTTSSLFYYRVTVPFIGIVTQDLTAGRQEYDAHCSLLVDMINLR